MIKRQEKWLTWVTTGRMRISEIYAILWIVRTNVAEQQQQLTPSLHITTMYMIFFTPYIVKLLTLNVVMNVSWLLLGTMPYKPPDAGMLFLCKLSKNKPSMTTIALVSVCWKRSRSTLERGTWGKQGGVTLDKSSEHLFVVYPQPKMSVTALPNQCSSPSGSSKSNSSPTLFSHENAPL